MKTETVERKSLPITPVMLAKDVLKWLEPGSKVKIKPVLGKWYVMAKGQSGADLQTLLKKGRQCEVCGVGALMCAIAYRQDNMFLTADQNIPDRRPGEVGTVSSAFIRVLEFFSSANRHDIEMAFELGTGVRAKTARGRLKEIMLNIVANKGKFIPKERA